MKEYAFVLLMLAGMITLVAVAFAAVVYLKYRFGRDTLKFELSRIAIVWAAIIALLLMIGCLILAVAGWTSENAISAFSDVLEWARHNRIMAEIILWGVTALLIMLLIRLETFTISSFIATSLLHIWATYTIWNSDEPLALLVYVWIALKVIAAVLFAVFYLDFDVLQRHKKGKNNVNAGQVIHPTQPTSAQSDNPDASQNAIEAIAETIAQHVDPIVQTVQD